MADKSVQIRAQMKDSEYVDRLYGQIKDYMPRKWQALGPLVARLIYQMALRCNQRYDGQTLGEEFTGLSLSNWSVIKLGVSALIETAMQMFDGSNVWLRCFKIAVMLDMFQDFKITNSILNMRYRSSSQLSTLNSKNIYFVCGLLSYTALVLNTLGTRQVYQTPSSVESVLDQDDHLMVHSETDGPSNDSSKCILCLTSPIVYGQKGIAVCGHVFCWKCIMEWVVQFPFCPVCKRSFRVTSESDVVDLSCIIKCLNY
ncbi:hypothetical protein MP228_002928 [Amoeboaphelidium protococcarum]|nr:hypothetical protein MP228_002928 [Amoeboaphelidium protococcarum]